MSYVVNANDASTPTDAQGSKQGAEELRALKTKIASVVAGAVITSAAGANQADLTTFIQPDVNDRPAITAGGWLPWNLNHQWGGAPMPFHLVDSATGTEYKFDAFDGYNDPNDTTNGQQVAAAAGGFYRYQSINPAKNVGLQAIWLRFFKVGNPVDNFTVKLWSVAAGLPNAVIATANTINGKQVTADPYGQWYRFSFAAVQNLIAGTQYIFTVEKSGGVDAVNFYTLSAHVSPTTKYPNNLYGTGTAAPVWAPTNTLSATFLCEAQASDQVVQSAGTFNGRIVGLEGNPINRSVGFIKPLREFLPLFHPNGWSLLIRGKSFTKDKTFAEIIYGLHHDRINIRSATGTGFTTVTVYENDNTVTTVAGTSDISSAGFKDILIVGRSMNDGADYIKIYVGINNVWTKEAESLALSLGFDPLMLLQGHMWLMGGFPLFKNTDYTKLSEMGILPSGDGWTFTTTTATVEGNVFAISGGKLNQIKAGYAAGGDGHYTKAGIALSNANGWFAAWKLRVAYSTNSKTTGVINVVVEDGAKVFRMLEQEYYHEAYDGAVSQSLIQVDNKTNDCTDFLTGKGTDVFHFSNGKLMFDGTGKLTIASANNQVRFGDIESSVGENADALWDYIGYYNTSNIYPQFTSAELHEFAAWSGDKNLLGAALYNLGVPYSVKQYCGIQRNFVGTPVNLCRQQIGITSNPTNAGAVAVIIPELECFVIGEYYQLRANATAGSTGTNSIGLDFYIDGRLIGPTVYDAYNNNASFLTIANSKVGKVPFGLHKVEVRTQTNAGTTTFDITRRQLNAVFTSELP